MVSESPPEAARSRRLAEELAESGFVLDGADDVHALVIEEIDLAQRPAIHERRVPSSGTIIEPTTESARWSAVTRLDIRRETVGTQPLEAARRFTDGLSSWLLRRSGADNEWIIFDRPAGSERDLVVVADAFGATIVQRHPAGVVRVVGAFGVLRWNGYSWHHEPPINTWIDAVTASPVHGDPDVLSAILDFAVHDLGALGVGSLLVYRPEEGSGPLIEHRLPIPPPLEIRQPTHLAPLRHALGQVDGAALFDAAGVLRGLGVRLVPSPLAEQTVEPLGGMRHTAARRYSHDDPLATVIAVSDDGPVTVLREGRVLGRSPP